MPDELRGAMKLGIMQPYFFPYFGYFRLMAEVDTFVFLDDVRFIKQGWINRNRILVGGNAHFITVPVEDPGLNGRICDIRIASGNWRRKMLETLRHAYRRAPHFEETFALARRAIESECVGINELAKLSTTLVADHLGIETQIIASSQLYSNAELRGQERVLDIVGQVGAHTYVNSPGGRALYSELAFEAQGVRLHFLDSQPFEYRQSGGSFVPNLSILDAMMWTPLPVLREAVTAGREKEKL